MVERSRIEDDATSCDGHIARKKTMMPLLLWMANHLPVAGTGQGDLNSKPEDLPRLLTRIQAFLSTP